MKKTISILSILYILFFAFVFTACQHSAGNIITQNTYIVPIWKGSLPSAPNNPEVGWAYYNTSVKKSFIYDGSSWQIMAQDGTDGLSIIWQGELSTAPSNPQINWAYYNTIDGNSYIYNGNSWDLLAKSGRDGASGILLWLGSYSVAPNNPSDGWAYYNTTDGVSYIYYNDSWKILSKDGDSIIWKGALTSAPENPSLNWAYYNINDQTSYIWNGSQWDTLSTSVGGDTIVTLGITWLGTLASAPLNPVIGNAYYNSTLGASYVYDGSSWQQISKDGINGTSSEAGYLITWKGSYSSAPSNPKAGWAYYNTSTRKSYIYDGSSWQILAQDGANGSSSSEGGSGNNNGLIFINETSETIDGVSYVVKAYADVYTPEPYFYTYYKFYYLNNKLRKTYVYYHSCGTVELDYKYDEFIEHTCGTNTSIGTITNYSEDGKIELQIQNMFSNGIHIKYLTYFTNGIKTKYEYFQDENLYMSTTYYNSGKTKESINYNITTGYRTNYYSYYENGNYEQQIWYDGETGNKTQHRIYYSTGQQKICLSYENGKLYRVETYYASGKDQIDSIRYNSDGTIDLIIYYYESGYVKYYYRDGYLYTYTDGKTTSTSTSNYSSKTAKNQNEIKTFAESLYDTQYN